MTGMDTASPRRRSQGPWQILIRRLCHNRIAVTGGLILALLYFLSSFAGFLSPYDYIDADVDTTRYGPMLLGGYHAVKVETYLMEDEDGNDGIDGLTVGPVLSSIPVPEPSGFMSGVTALLALAGLRRLRSRGPPGR